MAKDGDKPTDPELRLERRRQSHQAYYAKNRERKLAAGKKWRKANPNYYREWREAHPNYYEEWRKANPDKVAEYRLRAARKAAND